MNNAGAAGAGDAPGATAGAGPSGGGTSATGGTQSGGAGNAAGASDEGGAGGIGDTGGAAGTSGNAAATALELAPGEVCDRAERVGTLKLALSNDRTEFSGSIFDAVTPSSVFEVLAADGGCELLGPRSLFCDTECGSDQTCGGDDGCVPRPASITVGDLTVAGLLVPFDSSPNGITSAYSGQILDPYPSFDVGAEISLSATGGDASGSFTLEATGVAPMATTQSVVDIARDAPATFIWDASEADSETSAVYIDITVNPHGGTTGWIGCVVPDTGSFEVPASLVTQLIDLGLSGFPRATIGRRSTDGVEISGGCVDLRVSSEITVDLSVDGLVSCNADTDCPEGQSCTPELACAE